jgi:hypothetical protein
MNDREKVTIVINDLLKYKTDKDKSKTIDWILNFANTTSQEQTLPIDSVSGSACKHEYAFLIPKKGGALHCGDCDRHLLQNDC